MIFVKEGHRFSQIEREEFVREGCRDLRSGDTVRKGGAVDPGTDNETGDPAGFQIGRMCLGKDPADLCGGPELIDLADRSFRSGGMKSPDRCYSSAVACVTCLIERNGDRDRKGDINAFFGRRQKGSSLMASAVCLALTDDQHASAVSSCEVTARFHVCGIDFLHSEDPQIGKGRGQERAKTVLRDDIASVSQQISLTSLRQDRVAFLLQRVDGFPDGISRDMELIGKRLAGQGDVFMKFKFPKQIFP